MILRTIEEVLNSKNNVESDNWASRRFIVKKEGMRLICVFHPALTGEEVHDADGSYPLSE